jgi:hypothetical protein
MKRFWYVVIMVVLWTIFCFGQENHWRVGTLTMPHAQYKISFSTPEDFDNLQKQIKIQNLIVGILNDEEKGMHPYDKIALLKKEAKEMEP